MSPSRIIPFVFIMQDDEIGTFGAESLYDRIIIYAAVYLIKDSMTQYVPEYHPIQVFFRSHHRI